MISSDDMTGLLRGLVAIESFSRQEGAAADFLEAWMRSHGLDPVRVGNNIFVRHGDDASRPTVLLNAHIDTVKPVPGWTRDPFSPVEEDGRLYGLGTNDDGGSLVSLLWAWMELVSRPQPYNLIFSATAEEEVCGRDGFEAILPYVGKIDLGVIGEPTGMNLAVAEKGLMVLDCTATGLSGHAAREEGVNAIYKAIESIEWFRTYRFPRVSPFTGAVKMSVTQIAAGTQHNVVPAECTFVVDVRNNGMYSNVELLELIKASVPCQVRERSTRLNGSAISPQHPFVKRGVSLGLGCFGSPTASNQTLCPFTTVKVGPGDSSRSHTADEYILLDEIISGKEMYIKLLDNLIV